MPEYRQVTAKSTAGDPALQLGTGSSKLRAEEHPGQITFVIIALM